MPKAWRFAQHATIVALTVISSSAVIGQTANQLEQRYKHPDAFEVRQGVNAYPTFASDGNVCRLVVAKRPTVSNKLADMNTTISSALVKEIEDELAPPDERGRELSPYFSQDSYVIGAASLTKKDYENVSIGVYESSGYAYAIVITWRFQECPE